MLVESRESVQESLSQEKLDYYTRLRREVIESNVIPDIASVSSWLQYQEPRIKGAKPRENLPDSVQVANLLDRLSEMLLNRLDTVEKDAIFGSVHLGLYSSNYLHRGKMKPYMPQFNGISRDIFDNAASKFLTSLQGEVPLKFDYAWDDIVAIYEAMGKPLPKLPEELIWVDDPDGGCINDSVSVTLPTKAPFTFVSYRYKLDQYGKLELPSVKESDPKNVSLQLIRLDSLYPQAPYQRSIRFPGFKQG